MTNVVIASAARTAVGSFGGSFANTAAHDLGATVLEAVVERAGVAKEEVSETILGQVLTAGQGQNLTQDGFRNLAFLDTGAVDHGFKNGGSQIMGGRVCEAARKASHGGPGRGCDDDIGH